MAALAQNESNELACVMIPLVTTQLLLPNVSVAEIIPWRRLKTWDDAPSWCAGLLGWRGEAVPVLDFDALSSAGGQDAGRGRCLLVMNRARSSVGRPFYALAAAGLPRLVHLRAEDMESHSVQLGPTEVASVRVGTELAVVPNLSFIEEQLAGLPEFRLRGR